MGTCLGECISKLMPETLRNKIRFFEVFPNTSVYSKRLVDFIPMMMMSFTYNSIPFELPLFYKEMLSLFLFFWVGEF